MSEMQVPKESNLVSIESISNNITKGSTPTTYGYQFQSDGIPFLRAENIFLNQLKLNNTKFISEETHEFLKRSKINSGDVLITIAGTIGRATYVPENTPEMNSNQAVAIIKLKDSCIPKYLSYFLNSNNAKKQISDSKVTTSISNLSLEMVKHIKIPLFSIPIQKKIVAKLDHIFLKLDEKKKEILTRIENFDANKINENYKNHLLKLAFDGTLTKKWRMVSKSLENSKERWNISKPVLEDNGLTQLPKTWCYRKLNDICKRVSVAHVGPSAQFKSDKDSGIPYIRSQNIGFGKLTKLENIMYVSKEFHESNRKSQLIEGDLLIVRHGDQQNNVCILPKDFGPANCANIIFARPFENISEFLKFYFQSTLCQNFLNNNRTGAVQRVVNTKMVAQVPIPVPPLEEQKEITRILSEKFADWENHKQELQNIQNQHELIKKHLNSLSSSILNDAFSGKLVN